MLSTRSPVLAKTAYRAIGGAKPLAYTRISVVLCQYHAPSFNQVQQVRNFSFTSKAPIQGSQTLQIAPTQTRQRETRQSWPHPVYTEKQMQDIVIAHRNASTWSDKIALNAIRLLRSSFDLVTGYKHDPKIASGEKTAEGGTHFTMTEKKWMIRFIFLESIAGVPGFVAGTLRHLKSIRSLKRDNGWIETLLEEGYNERMHLLTFLKMHHPGIFMRLMVIGAQGVFYNAFFLAYLLSPRTCHRFVGYLEEEAVITYTRAIADIDAGKLPAFESMDAPRIALDYWKMPEGSKVREMLMYIRADEAKHREVNHTLANLDGDMDPNPFMTEYEDPTKPHPGKGIEHLKNTGWSRDEALSK
ncbi:hypothetical protein H072_8775 [Dactylellina haptotyla CBS 200.50]|uniref:Alternative oxidase n=1 Tax=Dactylellina haptotyla (strain CBS 200.50) TaxID=1284197 RepID=S8BE32_DACHA|nr:hypothetical protein H072_8775 [Dactylellina haptotyla CBS 200.50]